MIENACATKDLRRNQKVMTWLPKLQDITIGLDTTKLVRQKSASASLRGLDDKNASASMVWSCDVIG